MYVTTIVRTECGALTEFPVTVSAALAYFMAEVAYAAGPALQAAHKNCTA